MKVHITFKCPGCETGNKIVIRKPRLLEPVVAHVRCEVCESEWMARFATLQKSKGGTGQNVSVTSRPTKISPQLAEMLEETRLEVERRAAAAKPVEEAQP